MKYSAPIYKAGSGYSILTEECLNSGQDSRQRRLSKSTRNRRDALRRLATVLAEPTVLSLENHRRLQHLHRMPGP